MLTELVLATVLGLPGDKLEFRPKHVRPSRLAALYSNDKNSRLGKVESDDLEGVVRIWGATEDLESVEKIFFLSDVPRMQVYVRFRLKCDPFKLDYNGTMTMHTGVPFTFGDSESDSLVTVRPMITDKGTVRLRVLVQIGKSKFRSEKEARMQEQFIVKIPDMTPENEEAKTALKSTDARLFPTIYLSGEAVKPKK